AELVLQGPGLAGTDQINVGILSEAGSDYGNWKLRGFVGCNPVRTFDDQYKWSIAYDAMLMTSAMSYWIVSNGLRLVMVAKTGPYYEMVYLGLFLPYATPVQYPYPLLVGGSSTSSTRWSNVSPNRRHLPKSSGYSG